MVRLRIAQLVAAARQDVVAGTTVTKWDCLLGAKLRLITSESWLYTVCIVFHSPVVHGWPALGLCVDVDGICVRVHMRMCVYRTCHLFARVIACALTQPCTEA
jgi:hypothetical protein